MEELLLGEGYECFVPTVDAGVDFLAYRHAGDPPLRIQAKARSADQNFLWDIKTGQSNFVGEPTHFFFMHGSPPTDNYWLVPGPIVRKVWRSIPKGKRVILTKAARELFQPFKKEAGFRAARTWQSED